ncbi:MAG: alginate lyase family protein [Methylacidiphilales bacterium]|nr:alginate lyase family protein [Candidatus Methylacidiphilales bacterium]
MKKHLLIPSVGVIALFNLFAHGQTGSNTIAQPTPPPMPEGQSPEAQPESILGLAVMRLGDDQKELQPYRVKVGDKEYDFAHLLKLKPSDTDGATVQILVDFNFKHPGLLNDLKELDFIKQKIAAGAEPWATAFEAMKKSRYADVDYLKKMKVPPVVISCDFSGRNDHGSIQEMKDANAAYTQALMWYFTGDSTYAKNAAGILETYAQTVTSHEGRNWYLEVAWAGDVFPLSAELLRSTYPDWKNSRVIGKWFNDVFLPPLHDRLAFGNREFAVINAMAAIGIYNEDRAAFYLAMNHWMNYIPAYHYLSEDGPAPYLADYWTPEITPSDDFLLKLNDPSFPKDWTPWIELHNQNWSDEKIHGKFGDDSTGMRKDVAARLSSWTGGPVTYLPGYCGETARDFGHVEVSFATEINAAEMAWHQGIDVYTPQAKRLTTFMETQAKLRLGEPPPDSMTAKLVPYSLVGTWEIAYNHYANRMGMPLPNTLKIIEILRQAGEGGIRLPKDAPHDPANPRLWTFPPPFPSLFASGIGGSSGWISSWETLTHGDLDKH